MKTTRVLGHISKGITYNYRMDNSLFRQFTMVITQALRNIFACTCQQRANTAENVAHSPAKRARKPNFTPAEYAVIFEFSTTLSNKNKSRHVTYILELLMQFLHNTVAEFASRTLEARRLTGLFREGQRGIAFITRCIALERNRAYIRASCVSACVLVSVAVTLNLRQKKIETNWSEKANNQQNVNNTT